MELRVYDRDLLRKGTTDNASSIRWRLKYYEPGEFEIHLPATPQNINLFDQDMIIADKANGYSGIVEGIQIQKSKSKREITVTGRMIASILDRRLIKGRTIFNGEIEKIMFSIAGMISPFPHLVLGTQNGFTETVTFQATYKNALTYLTKLSKAGNIGYRITPDFEKKQYVFETYRGVDHSFSQHENNRVIFAESYDNLEGFTKNKNSKLYKNVMYIGGQGDSLRTVTVDGDTLVVSDNTPDTRTIVTSGDTALTGFDLREEFLSATDVTKEENESQADYESALKQRGDAKLNEDAMVDSIEGDVKPTGNFIFRRDWNIGDIVTVLIPEWNTKTDARVTEVEIVYEHGNMPTITPTFGTPIPDSIDWSDQ